MTEAENDTGALEEAASLPPVAVPGPVTTVAGLRPGTSGHELVLKVVSCKAVRPNRGGGGRISEAVVGDSSGVVVMTARQGQVDLVQPGNTIVVKNGVIDLYKVLARSLPARECD